MSKPEVSRSLRAGNTILWLDGYSYTRRRRNSAVWRCTHKKRFNCPGIIATDSEYPYSNIRYSEEHSHPPDEFAKKANSIRWKLRQMIEENPEISIAFVIKEGLKDLSEEEKSKLGSTVSIGRDLRNIKQAIKKAKKKSPEASEDLSSDNNLISMEEMDCPSMKFDYVSSDGIPSAAPFSQSFINQTTDNMIEPLVKLEECRGPELAWDGVLNQEEKSELSLPIIKVKSNTSNVFENINETTTNRCPVNISQLQNSSSHAFQMPNRPNIPLIAPPQLNEISTHKTWKTYSKARNMPRQSGHKNTQESDSVTYVTESTNQDRLQSIYSSAQTLNELCQDGLSVNKQTVKSHTGRHSGFLSELSSFVTSQSQWYGYA